jgi:protein-S-isoprenylcysteine O-methyltransferase Ste14
MKIKIVPDGYFVILLLMSILFHFIFPIAKILFYPYSYSSIFFIITGIIIVFRTNFILLKNATSIKPSEIPCVLITFGPFRYSRNPIYLGMTIILFGVEILLGSLSPFIFPIIFLIIINKSIIPDEENKLEKIFGEKYLDYKTEVRRWI